MKLDNFHFTLNIYEEFFVEDCIQHSLSKLFQLLQNMEVNFAKFSKSKLGDNKTSLEDFSMQYATKDTGVELRVKMKQKIGLKTMAGLVMVFLITITGLAAGMFIMNLTIQSLKKQNLNFKHDLDSQQKIVEDFKYQNEKLSLKLANTTKLLNLTQNENEDLNKASKKYESELSTFKEFLRHYTLHEAAERGDWRITQLLLLKGVDINALNEDGETALNLAAKLGHADVVEILLRHGARKDLNDPLKSARLNKLYRKSGDYDRVIRLLKYYRSY